MVKEAILEFRLGNELYCFNTKIIKYVFDLEEFEEFVGLDEVVRGIVRYDDDAMLLIDTLYLYTEKEHIELEGSKSVIVIEDENEALYGMLVDEIIKIEDVEPAPSTLDLSNDELVIRHYKEKDNLVNEVVPLPLLHAKKIPSFKKELSKEHENEEAQVGERDEFLLFKIETKLFALDTTWVKEVVERESGFFELESKSTHFKGAVAIRDDVYKVANLKPEAKEGSELVVIEKESDNFCIAADQVFGIEFFEAKRIEPLADTLGYIKGFYNKDGEVVAILDESFFIARQKEDKPSKIEKENSLAKQKSTRKGFLIFKIGEKDFAMDIHFVRQVVEEDDIPHTSSAAISSVAASNVAFITEWNHHGVEVLSLANMLGIEYKQNLNEVIMIEVDTNLNGVLVEKVDDIYYAKAEDVTMSDDKEVLINGTLFKDEKLIAILNPYKVIQ